MREGGLSYSDVGEALDVHPVTVRNWEKDGMPKVASLAFKYVFRKNSFSERAPFWVNGGKPSSQRV